MTAIVCAMMVSGLSAMTGKVEEARRGKGSTVDFNAFYNKKNKDTQNKKNKDTQSAQKQHNTDMQKMHITEQQGHDDAQKLHEDMGEELKKLDSDLAAIPPQIANVGDDSAKAALQGIYDYLSAKHELEKKMHEDIAQHHGDQSEQHGQQADMHAKKAARVGK